MRTTVELPPELMRAAKALAAKQGESLKHWFARAVAGALGKADGLSQARDTSWPVFGKPGGKKVRVTNRLLADVEAAEDVDTYRRGLRQSR